MIAEYFITSSADPYIPSEYFVGTEISAPGRSAECEESHSFRAVEEFSEIAKRTKGVYTIVDKDSEPINGFDYQKNPKDFEGRL